MKIRGKVEFFAEKDGKIIDHWIEENLIVSKGKQAVCYLLATGNANKIVNKIGFGTGATEPLITDTALSAPFIKAIGSSISYPALNQIKWDWELGLAEGNGVTYYEMGLLTQAGDLFARKVRSAMVKNAETRFFGSWTLTF